ncbi:hypothetical protein [Embleya hyalina]|uniref:Uncharacterized protein n=1 Tax=Embleya hyalina TaxID=516124 RepID=A0A401YR92_9ACTN|nr:hypothetical protein [Embleya hyalina]GCD97119.1 hypothetical protein EHYA_04807 [Embleya hyalina]
MSDHDNTGDFTVTIILPGSPRQPDCPTRGCLLPAGHNARCMIPNR